MRTATDDPIALAGWLPIATAPRHQYFLARITPDAAATKLRIALGIDPEDPTIGVVYRDPKDAKGRVRCSRTGRLLSATHWVDVPRQCLKAGS